MMDLTYNNYYKGHGYESEFRITMDPVDGPVGSFYEEMCKVADIVWTQKQGPLYVCYSGGLDSEYVLSLFLSLGMRITPVIMRLLPNYNDHDTWYALKFCKDNNLSYYVFDLDFDEFVRSGKIVDIAGSCECNRIELPASMWLASQLDGTVVTGNDPMVVYSTPAGPACWEPRAIYTQIAFWQKAGIHGTPFFTTYTPGASLSFLKDPSIVWWVNNPNRSPTTTDIKIDVYNNQHKFKLQPRKKFTGYEKVMQSPIYNHPNINLVRSWKHFNGLHMLDYYDAIRMLEGVYK